MITPDKVLLTAEEMDFIWAYFCAPDFSGCWDDVITLAAQQKLMRLLAEKCDRAGHPSRRYCNECMTEIHQIVKGVE